MSAQTLETKKWTYEDYARLDDQNRYEVIEGELVMAPSPVTKHQRVSGRLGFHLQAFVEKHKSGEIFYAPFDVILSPDNVFQPDILFISTENLGILSEKKRAGRAGSDCGNSLSRNSGV